MPKSTYSFNLLLNHRASLNKITSIDLEMIFKESLYHDLSSLIYLIIKKANKGPGSALSSHPVLDRLRDIYLITIKDNILKQEEFINVHAAFELEGIVMVPIKGMALLFDVFQDDFSRSMSDIDILIKKEDLKKAEKILQDLSYRRSMNNFSEEYYYNQHCHIPFLSKYLLELHWDIAVPRPNKIILPEIWDRLQKIKYNSALISLLSPEDTIFSIGLHLRRFNQPLSLKYIYDLYKIIEKYADKIDWPYISKYSNLNKFNSVIYYSLCSIKIIFDYPLPAKILNMFYPGILRAFLLKIFIIKVKHNGVKKIVESRFLRKYLYVFLRFLLYDSFIDFIKFIINIPIEEFAYFYSIEFPSKKASIVYSLRFIIMPFYLLIGI